VPVQASTTQQQEPSRQPAPTAPTYPEYAPPPQGNPAPGPTPEPTPKGNNPLPTLVFALWATGAVGVGGWYVTGYLRVRRTISQSAVPAGQEAQAILAALEPQGHVQLVESPAIGSPLLLGLFRPMIVLPVGLTDPARLRDILSHELTHARRYDLLVKWFAALAASIHWFNPLLILVRREIGRACELACDEAVVKALDAPARKHYGESLLSLAIQPPGLALPMAGEKRNLQERLVSLVKIQKRTPAAILLTLAFVVALGGCSLFTNAAVKPEDTPLEQEGPTGLMDPVSGVCVQLDMTKAEVDDLLGPGYCSGEYDSWYPNHKTDSRYIYTTEAGPIAVKYVDGVVISLFVETRGFLGPDTSRWATETGISCGSNFDEAVQHYQESEIHEVFHKDGLSQFVCQGSTDLLEKDSYWMDIQADEDGKVYEITLQRARKATVLMPSGLKNSSTGTVISFFQSRSEVEALLGPGIDDADANALGNFYHTVVYGKGPDTLYVLYRQDKAVSFRTYPGTENSFDSIAQPGASHWRLEDGTGCGSTLAEVQQAYPGGKLVDNPQQGGTEAGAVHQLYKYLGSNIYATLSLHEGAVIGVMLDLCFPS